MNLHPDELDGPRSQETEGRNETGDANVELVRRTEFWCQ